MQKKDVLVKFGSHTRLMAQWLEKKGIGKRDKYDRGMWVNPSALQSVADIMRTVPRNAHAPLQELWISLNTHNQLSFTEVCEALIPDLRERKIASQKHVPLSELAEKISEFWESEFKALGVH